MKKFCAILLSITLLVSYLPVSAMAADVTQNLPVNNEMESVSGITGIDPGYLSLTQDRVSGDYAVKASYGDIPNLSYARYTLAASGTFDTKKYSQIKLWVKPGAGTSWIKFYTNNSIITSDQNGDGIFKIGEDLVSGKWNAVTLDLSKLSISSGKDLMVDTNEYSTWTFDEVKSLYTPLNSVDITFMDDDKTQLVNGQLQFKKNSDTFNTTPTVLTPGTTRDFTKTETDQSQFQQGTLTNVKATAAGDLELSNSLTGNRISPALDISSPYSATSSQISWNGTNPYIPAGTFTRSSLAYQSDGIQAPSGIARFEAGKYGKGVMIEETTTNLLSNTVSDGTSVTGFSKNSGSSSSSFSVDTSTSLFGNSSILCTTNTSTWAGILTPTVTVVPGQTYTFSVWVKGTGTVVIGALYGSPWWTASQPVTLTSNWKRLTLTYTIPAGNTLAQLGVTNGNAGGVTTCWLDGFQIEQKPYATSWNIGGSSRSNETLTVPATVLNKPEGSIEGWFNINQVKNSDYNAILTTGTTSPRLLIMRDGSSGGKLKVWDHDGSGEVSLSSSTTIQPNTWYHFAYTWSPTSGRALYLNGIKEASNTTTRGIGFGADNLLYIGSWASNNPIDGVIDDIRLSNRARTQAEIQTAYASVTPSQLDNATIYKMSLDGNLQGSAYDFFMSVETRISLDEGVSWQAWKSVTNGSTIPGLTAGTKLSKARFQYKVNLSTLDISLSPQFHDITIKIGQSNISNEPKLSGKISNIFIDSGYVNTAGAPTSLSAQKTLLSGIKPTVMGISGDGKKVYYANPSDGSKLYLLDLITGENKRVSDTLIPLAIKVNENGSKAAVKVQGSSSIKFNIYAYDHTNGSAGLNKSDLTASDDFDIQANGTIYVTYAGSLWGGATVSNIKSFTLAKKANTAFYVTLNNGIYSLYKYLYTPSGWNGDLLTTSDKSITLAGANQDGSLLIVKMSGDYYSFHVASKGFRMLDFNATSVKVAGVTSDNRIIYLDDKYRIKAYDLDTDIITEIRPGDTVNPPDATTLYFDVDYAGNKMAYTANGGLSTSYIKGVQRPERYAFSFDGKNSWHTYKDGLWSLVRAGAVPSEADLTTYGMTIDEVNGMTPADFEGLYADGREITQFDVAVYFASVDAYTSPALKGIRVTLNGGQADSGGPVLEKSLYTTKQQRFNAKTWRKIKKIYAVEMKPGEGDIRYFIMVDSVYKSYKNNQWNSVAASLLTDVETNWIKITQQGMTADELRAIPENALKDLAGKENLTVIYGLKIEDGSTAGYSSDIKIDYVDNFFDGQALTLNINFMDGTTKAYTGLDKKGVEDFMEWLSNRQGNKGSYFYTIKTIQNNVEVNDFINFYSIKSVSVDDTIPTA